MAVSSTSNSSSRTPLNTVDGLVSGIKSSAVIDGLINAERASTKVIENRKTVLQGRLDALRSYNTKMLSAQLDLGDLRRTSTFQARIATSSNDAALSSPSATSSAVPGTYTLDVLRIAQAQQIATTGQVSATAAIGVGTVNIQLGSAPPRTLDFSAGGSLNDIASAINAADIGINASVVKDGSASPFRLILQSKQTGVDNTILVNGSGGMSSLLSGMSTLNAASDAQVRIGGGAGITITQSSNTFTDVVPGVSLVAKALANGVTVTVANDATAAKVKIKSFVDSFNTAITYLNTNTKYDATKQNGGILIGDSSLRSGLSSIQRTLTNSVPGLPQSLNALSAIGITISKDDGTLSIDNAKLTDQLSTNLDGVMKLFTNSGSSTNGAVQFSFLTDKTKVDHPFSVAVTQPAAQAIAGSASDMAASTVISGVNNQLNLIINGDPISVTLTNGTYTREQLAQHVQTVINAAVPSKGDQLSASITGNRLDLRTNNYGSSQSISILSTSTVLSGLGLSLGKTLGVDVAGTIDGVAGVGSGQLLKGAVNTTAEGLSLNVTATIPVSGVTITARKGIAQQASERFMAMTNSAGGALVNKQNTLNTTIDDMSKQISRADAMLAKRRQSYQAQFTAMEQMVSKFQSQGNYFLSQMNALNNSNK